MPVLVDGYNLLHALRDSRWGTPAVGRAMLCKLLGDWSAATGEPVTIVFDGNRPEDAVAGQLGDPRIAVHYSGGTRNADVLIGEVVGASSAPRRLLVVSSDREVQRSARRREALVTTSQEFCGRMMRDLQADAARRSGDPGIKGKALDKTSRDDWLRQFGFDPEDAPPFEHQ